MKKGRIASIFWKSREWNRVLEKLHGSYRQLAKELFSVVANEENRLARMETDEHLESIAINRGRKDLK
jgi:flagellar biosynthesis regulator FlaF